MGRKVLARVPDRSPRDGCGCGCGPRPVRGRVGRHLPLLPAFAIVLLPKCPLCAAAWLGALGSLGTGPWVPALYGAPLTLGLASFGLCALAMNFRSTREPRPLLLGALGALVLLAGRGPLDVPPMVYAGLLLLTGAVVWSGRTRGRAVTVA